MERICSKLELMADFNDKTALEFFARDGSWQAMPIIKRVGGNLWEIDPSFYSTLSTIKNSEVVIGDSFQLISSLDQDVLLTSSISIIRREFIPITSVSTLRHLPFASNI